MIDPRIPLALGDEVDQLHAEINEQARLLGVSAEKELALRAENERMRNTLVSVGYTDEGGELWKPPLGKSVLPVFEDNERLKAELAEAKKGVERYRWLRNNPVWVGYDSDFRPDEIDAAIDAGMKGK